MRLIDADALLEKAYWKGEVPTQDNLYADGCEVVNATDVEDAPTIEAEPVRHGRWRDYSKDSYTCSNCKYTVPKDDYGYKYPYCPHCGAKMDLED